MPPIPSPAALTPTAPFPSPTAPFPAPIASLITDLLHEMGQPLTTLQGCQLLPLLAATDRDALASEMAGQVERMTDLYRALRQLLAATVPASPAPAPPSDLHHFLHAAAAKWQRQAERQHVQLTLNLAQPTALTSAISPWTEHAIECVIAAALAHSPAGSQLCLSPTPPPAAASLTFAASPHTFEPATPSASLDLRVAQTLLQAQGGRVVYSLQPFRAVIDLPGTEILPLR